MGGNRGRLITATERYECLKLIDEACAAGARKRKACELLGISLRTLERWHKSGWEDKRQFTIRTPVNRLTLEEREMVLKIANNELYRDLPPSKIGPLLADAGLYIASESTFYRILHQEKQMSHRRLSRPAKHHKPKEYVATSPNQVWTWDISYLPTQISGMYFYLSRVSHLAQTA